MQIGNKNCFNDS